jgi:serine protease Do
MAAAVGVGYTLRGTQGIAQQGMTKLAVAPVVETPATKQAVSMQNAFEDVAKSLEPAVVTITTTVKSRPARQGSGGPGATPFGGGNGGNGGEDPFDEFFRRFRDFGFNPNSVQKDKMRGLFHQIQDERGGGLGSGMIYDTSGLILTNAHVVAGADTVTVKLDDGTEYKHAKVLGSDERTDVAVVKINATNLPTVKFGDSSAVNVGDWAIAVGNPFGLTHTVTVGVISAKAREVNLNPRNAGDFLQTDASINPGNSGGPLCDIYGRVIGINNAIYSQSGGNIGIGFAVPINTARDIARRLVKEGRIVRGYLGVKISNIDDNERAAALGLDPSTRGVLVEEVSDPDGPAAKAGIQTGDVILSFNGQTVTRSADLQRMVGDAPVGSEATMKVLRGGKTLTLTARLTELKDEGNGPGALRRPGANPGGEDDNGEATTTKTLGLNLRPLNAQLAQRFGLKQTQGVVVVSVDPNSPAAESGLRAGDIIQRVGQTATATPQDVQNQVKALLDRQTGEDKSVALYVISRGEGHYVQVDVSGK